MRKNVTSATSKSNATASRRGVALVMFVLLVFVFMGMAALSIDMGMASLTQAQMQNAVDSAALEGVATRDMYDARGSSNHFRRQYVVPMRVRDIFDDDFVQHVSAPEQDAGHYGAGPAFRISNGIGDANASALIEEPTPGQYTVPEPYVDSPGLKPNTGNDIRGDILSGTYIPPPPHMEEPDWHAETPGSYFRRNFEPSTDASAHPLVGIWDRWRSLGMLVRMRRITPAGSFDNLPGISSHGPAVPLFFGLGSTVHAEDETRNIRRDGLSVRATAIASGVPVLSAGPLQSSEDCTEVLGREWRHINDGAPRMMYGIAPIFIEKTFWLRELPDFVDGDFDNRDVDQDRELIIDELGQLFVTSGPFVEPAGRVYFPSKPEGMPEQCYYGRLASVGMRLPPPSMTSVEEQRLRRWLNEVSPQDREVDPEILANNGRCYIAIFTSIVGASGSVDRVVGFVHGAFEWNGEQIIIRISKGWKDADDLALLPDHPSSALNQPCSVLVAPENASSRAFGDFVQPDVLTEEERTQIFRHLLNLTYRTYPEPPAEPPHNWTPTYDWRDFQSGALLAPALVR